MGRAFDLLLVEDDEDDALLVVRELERAGLAPRWRRVFTRGDLEAALSERQWGCVLLDYALPGFGGEEALAVVRALQPDTPVIVVSGTAGEEAAVAMMRAGANDYFLKDALRLLPAAVERELREARERRARHEAERRYAAFFQHDIAAAYISTVDGKLLDCNPSFLETFRFASREEALATPVDHLYERPGDREAVLALVRRGEAVRNLEVRLRRRDGTAFEALVNAVGLAGSGGAPERIQGHILDISEQRRLERELLQAQKMESIGRLAGGVAHDFNNILQIVKTQLDLARMGEVPPELAERLEAIGRAADRAADLTRKLLAFSRRQVLERKVVELADIVGGMLKLLRRTIGEDVELDVVAAAGELPVWADPGQVEQVLTNLVVNARDAMPEGGRITIRLFRQPADPGFTRDRPWATEPEYAAFAVEDTGTGMPPEVAARVFEPFFTTKPAGRGTGLGLSTAYGIVTQHGGMIEVASEPGRGSVFTVYLPLAGEAQRAAAREAEAARREPPRGRGEVVLVAEDDPELRRATAEALERAGYVPVEAPDGVEAVAAFAAEPERFALVMLDVVMPRMGGAEAAERIRALRADVPVVFCSGYSDEALAGRLPRGAGDRLLRKPYAIADLLETVAAALGRA